MFSRAFYFWKYYLAKFSKVFMQPRNGISGNQYCGHVCVIVYAEKYGER